MKIYVAQRWAYLEEYPEIISYNKSRRGALYAIVRFRREQIDELIYKGYSHGFARDMVLREIDHRATYSVSVITVDE